MCVGLGNVYKDLWVDLTGGGAQLCHWGTGSVWPQRTALLLIDLVYRSFVEN